MIRVLISLNIKNYEKIIGTVLKQIAHNNLGIDNVEFVYINCTAGHERTTGMYRFNKVID